MTALLTSIPVRDENASLFVGGRFWFDRSGTGIGPWMPANVIVNPTTGVPLLVNADGSLNMRSLASGSITDTQATTITASAAETTIVTATAAEYHDLVSLIVSNTGSVNGLLTLRQTTGGAAVGKFQSVTGAGPIGFVIPGGLPQDTVNTNWTLQSSVAITSLEVFAVFNKRT